VRNTLATLAAAGLLLGPSAGALAAVRHSAAAITTGWAPTATGALPLAAALDLGTVPPMTGLRIVVALRANTAAATALAKHLYTKGDPQYHQFLTPAQYTALFAPSTAAASAVASYLSSEGMTNVQIAPNRLLVTAHATAAQAAAAFKTSIHGFSKSGHAIYGNVTPAMVPATLSATVLSVLGLSNVQFQTFNHRANAATLAQFASVPAISTPQTFSAVINGAGGVPPTNCNNLQWKVDQVISVDGGVTLPVLPIPEAPLPVCVPASFTPNQMRVAYDDEANPTGLNSGGSDFTEGQLTGPTGVQQVASDLDLMAYYQGIHQPGIYVVQAGDPGTDTSGLTEWEIDSQATLGLSGGLAHYVFYNSNSLSESDMDVGFNRFVTDDFVQVGNASFGGCESLAYALGEIPASDQIFQEGVLQGQTIFVSSGDQGSACYAVAGENGYPDGTPGVEYPASSPWVIAVGGTTLVASSTNGAYQTEAAWKAGGGGVSYVEPQSAWQAQLVTQVTGSPAGNRIVPDVAMDADPETGFYLWQGGKPYPGWGGTSLSAPLAAGVYARIESASNNTWGNAGPALYLAYLNGCGGVVAGLFNSTSKTCPSLTASASVRPPIYGGFNDVELGANGAYQALPGYDLTTGMGSFDINQLFIQFGQT